MPPPSRRTLAVLAVAAFLALGSPGTVRALPVADRAEPRGFLQQLLDGASGWVQSLLAPLWEATGSGLDPSGGPTPNGDTGSGLDPNGGPTSNDDNGSGLDPDG